MRTKRGDYRICEDGRVIRTVCGAPYNEVKSGDLTEAIREVARLQEENGALRNEVIVLRSELDEHAAITHAPAALYYREPHCGGGICECGGCV